ncbi:multidrug efflux SMR transporter, partial [Massilia sp. ST3]|uniref:DMT family transporter n=1 Tax=Massilia sp. ST3 TaxID=2824903 RepID=UPI001B81DD54
MSSLTAWVLLLAAGLVEVGMAFALKASEGWTRPAPSLLAVLAALGSIYLLATALRGLPLGVAYAVWTGIGAVGVTLAGFVFFAEHLSLARLGCMGL